MVPRGAHSNAPIVAIAVCADRHIELDLIVGVVGLRPKVARFVCARVRAREMLTFLCPILCRSRAA